MGKVTKLLEKIRNMSHVELFDRYKHLVRAQAVKEYLATKEDAALTLEANLLGEEVMTRMLTGHSHILINKEEE